MSLTPWRFVAELSPITGGGGATTTFRVATSGWTTLPTDTPAEVHIPARLGEAGTYQRELFKGRRVMGDSRPSWGSLTILNDEGAYDAWLDYGWAGAAVTLRYGPEDAAYPAGYTTVFVCQAQRIEASLGEDGKGGELRIRLRDGSERLAAPVVASSFAGTGGLEGTTAVAGKLKQWVSGDPGFVPPILIDASLQLYFVQATSPGSLASSFKLYEGGVEITRGADYSSASDCTSNAPAAGQCRFWFGSGGGGPVYFRRNAAPSFDQRVQCFGYQAGGTAWTLPALAALAGVAGGAGSVVVGPQLVDDGRTTYLEVMEDACAAQFAWFGMTRLNTFTCGVFDVPGATPAYTFTRHNAKGWQLVWPEEMEAPVWQVTVDAGTTWPGNVQASATDTLKDYVTRTPVWCSFAGEQATVRTNNPTADSVSLQLRGRHFQNATDQSTFLTGFFNRFGTRRTFWQCTVQLTANTLALELGDTVAIKLPRFGLSAGKNMRIVTQLIDCNNKTITFGLWG